MKYILLDLKDSLVVLDDENLDVPHLIKTKPQDGLIMENAEKAIKILNGHA